jgi:methyl-accepting chemotaxis protein
MTELLKKLGFDKKVIILSIVLITVTLLTFSIVISNRMKAQSTALIEAKVDSAVLLLSKTSADFLWQMNNGPLSSIIEEVKQDPEIDFIQVVGAGGGHFAGDQIEEDFLAKRKFKEMDIVGQDGSNLGKLRLVYNTNSVEANIKNNNIFVFVLSIFSLIFSGVVLYIAMRSIIKSVYKVLHNVDNSSGETEKVSSGLQETSENISRFSSDQIRFVQETSAGVAQMSSTIDRSQDISKAANASSKQLQLKSNEGQTALQNFAQSMEELTHSSEELAEIVEIFNQIQSETQVIKDIVRKTQLLSFNASIEAERAGQHGRGFTVVASEVGELAKLSGVASQKIEKLLENSNKKVASTVDEMRNRIQNGKGLLEGTQSVFTEFQFQAGEIGKLSVDLDQALSEQTIGVQKVAESITEIQALSDKSAEEGGRLKEASGILRSNVESLTKNKNRLGRIMGLKKVG